MRRGRFSIMAFARFLAPSYADIFYNNCFKNGILPVTLSNEQMDELFKRTEQNEGYRLTVDLEKQVVTDEKGLSYSFTVDPFRRECLLKGLDDIGLTLVHEEAHFLIRAEESPPSQNVRAGRREISQAAYQLAFVHAFTRAAPARQSARATPAQSAQRPSVPPTQSPEESAPPQKALARPAARAPQSTP